MMMSSAFSSSPPSRPSSSGRRGMAVSHPIDIPKAIATTSHDSPRSPLFASPSRRSMSPMGGSAVGAMKKFLRRKKSDSINDDIHDDDLPLYQPSATTNSFASSSVSMMQSFVLVGGYGAEPGSTIILDNISNGSDGGHDSHYGDMTDVVVGIAKTATAATAATTTITTQGSGSGSSSSNFFGRFSKDRSSITGHGDLGIPGSSSRKGRSRHPPGTENGESSHGSVVGCYGSNNSGLLAATAATMRRKLNRRSLSADSAPAARLEQQQEQRVRKPPKSRPTEKSREVTTTRSFEILSDLDKMQGIQSPEVKVTDDTDNSFVIDPTWSLNSSLGSQNFSSSYNTSSDGLILDTMDKPRTDSRQKQMKTTEKASRTSTGTESPAHRQRNQPGSAWASSPDLISSMGFQIDAVSEGPVEVAPKHGPRRSSARRQSESVLDRLEKIGNESNFFLVAETSSPTQFYDASHTRDVLRKYLSVKSNSDNGATERDLFDEMIEYGFPSDALEKNQDNNSSRGGEDTGSNTLSPGDLRSDETYIQGSKDGGSMDLSSSPSAHCRYMTLRVTLTPWHARADECQLYGPASSVPGRHQLKTRVNRFFSRSSNASSSSLLSSTLMYPSSISLHSSPLTTRSISSVLLSASNDASSLQTADLEAEPTKLANFDQMQMLTPRSVSVAELREIAMQSTPTSPTFSTSPISPASPVAPSSAPPSRPGSRAMAMNSRKSTRNTPTPPFSAYRVNADGNKDTTISRVLSPPPPTATFARSLRSPSSMAFKSQNEIQSQSPPRKGSLSALSLPLYILDTNEALSTEEELPPNSRRKGSTPAIFFSPAAAAAATLPASIADEETNLPARNLIPRSMTINVSSAQAGNHHPRAISPRYPFPEHYRTQERPQKTLQHRQEVTSPTLPPRKQSDQADIIFGSRRNIADESIHPMARIITAEVQQGLHENQHGHYGYGSMSTPTTPLATSTGQGELWSPPLLASTRQYQRSGSMGSGPVNGPLVPKEQGRIRRAISKDDYLYQRQHQEILTDVENITGLESNYKSGVQEWILPSLGSHSQNRRPSHQNDGAFYAPRTTTSLTLASQLIKQPRDPRRPSRSSILDVACTVPSPNLDPQQQQLRQGTRLFEEENEHRVQHQQSQDFPSTLRMPPTVTAKSAYRQRQGSAQSNASSTATLSNDNINNNNSIPKNGDFPNNETMKTSNDYDRYEDVDCFGAEYDTSTDPDLSFGSVFSTVSMPEGIEDRVRRVGYIGDQQQGEKEVDHYPIPRPRPRRVPQEPRDTAVRKGGCWRPIECNQTATMTTFAFP